jgi:hypothetical protein
LSSCIDIPTFERMRRRQAVAIPAMVAPPALAFAAYEASQGVGLAALVLPLIVFGVACLASWDLTRRRADLFSLRFAVVPRDERARAAPNALLIGGVLAVLLVAFFPVDDSLPEAWMLVAVPAYVVAVQIVDVLITDIRIVAAPEPTRKRGSSLQADRSSALLRSIADERIRRPIKRVAKLRTGFSRDQIELGLPQTLGARCSCTLRVLLEDVSHERLRRCGFDRPVSHQQRTRASEKKAAPEA